MIMIMINLKLIFFVIIMHFGFHFMGLVCNHNYK